MDERDPEVALQPPELAAHAHAKEGVQGRERLVEEEHRGIGDERAGERDALLLSAGELRGHALHVPFHMDEAELPSAASWRSGFGTPRIRRLNATLSRQFRCGNSA